MCGQSTTVPFVAKKGTFEAPPEPASRKGRGSGSLHSSGGCHAKQKRNEQSKQQHVIQFGLNNMLLQWKNKQQIAPFN